MLDPVKFNKQLYEWAQKNNITPEFLEQVQDQVNCAERIIDCELAQMIRNQKIIDELKYKSGAE